MRFLIQYGTTIRTGRALREDGGRGWGDASTSKELQRLLANHQKYSEAQNTFFPHHVQKKAVLAVS